MTKKDKKILLIFPHNFFEQTSGVNRRFYNIAKYLNTIGYGIDLFTLKNFESKWETGYPFDNKIVDKLFFYDVAQNHNTNYKSRLINKLKKIIGLKTTNRDNTPIQDLPDYSTPQMKAQLIDILTHTEYSHIIIGYAYWANLLKDVDIKEAKKVIFIEDWLTVQMKDYYHGNVNIMNFLNNEIERINMFDYAIELSIFENYLFSQLAPNPKHILVPIFLQSRDTKKSKNIKYDVAFIAHKNNYNIEGIKWFIKEVMPLIPKTKLLIVGKVNADIGKLRNINITQIEYVENLDDIYKDVKVIICPLFGGTGLKVKIVESISYGTPVVCTPQSLVGFPYENENGILIARNPIDFANQVTKLISNHKLHTRESQNALKYFNNYFSAEATATKLNEIFK